MGLKGNLSAVNLADVFQVLSRGNSTGLLRVQAPEGPRFVEIQNGTISIAGRSAGRIMLGDLLLSRGLLEETKLETALQIQKESGKLLGQVLIELGYVTMESLEQALRFQIEEEVCELFLLRSGEFDFLASATLDAKIAPGGGMVRLKLDPNALLVEAARRADEWIALEKRITSQAFLFQLTSEGTRLLGSGDGISPEGGIMLRLVRSERTVESMVQKACLGRLTTNQMLVELWDAGMIQPLPFSGYEKIAREHLRVRRFDEAQRIAEFTAQSGAGPDKESAQAILAEIDKARKMAHQASSVNVRTDPKVRSEVIRRSQPGLILKKERSKAPIVIMLGLAALACAAAVYYFVIHKEEAGAVGGRRQLDEAVSKSNDLMNEGKFADALQILREFKTFDPELLKLAQVQFEQRQKEVELKLLSALERFNIASSTGTIDEVKAALDALEQFTDLGVMNLAVEAERAKTRVKIKAYKEELALGRFSARLKEIQAREKNPIALEKAYAVLLMDYPPEELASRVRDETSKLYKSRLEAARGLKQAAALRQATDLEGAKLEYERIKLGYAGTPAAAEAEKALGEIAVQLDAAQAELGKIEALAGQKKNDEARAALLKFFQARPPSQCAIRAAGLLHSLPDPSEAEINLLLKEAAGLADKQPAEARKKLLQALQSAPYSKAIYSLALSVQVSSEPAGAEVFMDGKPAGKTPATLRVPCVGVVHFTFQKDGFQPHEITVNDLRAETLQVYLNRAPASSRRMPAPASSGLAASGEHLLLAGAGEFTICARADLKVLQRTRLTGAESGTAFKPAAFPALAVGPGQAVLGTGDKLLYRVHLPGGESSRMGLNGIPAGPLFVFTSQQAPGKRFIGLATDFGFETYDFESGSSLKRVTLPPLAEDSPAVTGCEGEMFFVPRRETLVAIEGHSGIQKWEMPLGARILAVAALRSSVAAIDASGLIHVLDAEKGARRFKHEAASNGPLSCAAAGDCFIISCKDGKAFGLAPGANQVLWSAQLGGDPLLPMLAIKPGEREPSKTWAVCTQSAGEHFLCVLSADKGALLWRAELNDKPVGLAADGKRVYVSTADSELSVFDVQP